MKRIISMLLAVLLLVNIFGGVAVAADSGGVVYQQEEPDETDEESDDGTTDDGSGDEETTEEDGSTEEESEDSGDSEEESEEEQEEEKPYTLEDLIQIRQPSYVDGSASTTEDDTRLIYEVSGADIEIFFSDEIEVLESSVIEDARLQFDSRSEGYVLTVPRAGTYEIHITFNFEGETYNERFWISVEDSDYVHLTTESHSDLQDKALTYERVMGTWGDFCEGVDDCEKLLTGDSYDWYEFYNKPLQALQNQGIGLLTMIFLTAIGWILVGIVIMLWMGDKYKTKRSHQVTLRQLDVIGEIDLGEIEYEAKRLKRLLAEKEFQDLGFSDSDSQFFRHKLGENPLTALKELMDYIQPVDIVKMYLEAYSQLGYSIIENADGDYEISEEEDGLDPKKADEDVIDGLNWSNIESDIIHEAEDIHLPLSASSADIADDMGVRFESDGYTYAYLESRSEFAGLISDLIQKIAVLDEFDSQGRLREEYDLLNLLWIYLAESSERYRIPLWHYREVFLKVQEEMDNQQSLQSDIDSLDKFGEIR